MRFSLLLVLSFTTIGVQANSLRWDGANAQISEAADIPFVSTCRPELILDNLEVCKNRDFTPIKKGNEVRLLKSALEETFNRAVPLFLVQYKPQSGKYKGQLICGWIAPTTDFEVTFETDEMVVPKFTSNNNYDAVFAEPIEGGENCSL